MQPSNRVKYKEVPHDISVLLVLNFRSVCTTGDYFKHQEYLDHFFTEIAQLTMPTLASKRRLSPLGMWQRTALAWQMYALSGKRSRLTAVVSKESYRLRLPLQANLRIVSTRLECMPSRCLFSTATDWTLCTRFQISISPYWVYLHCRIRK